MLYKRVSTVKRENAMVDSMGIKYIKESAFKRACIDVIEPCFVK